MYFKTLKRDESYKTNNMESEPRWGLTRFIRIELN